MSFHRTMKLGVIGALFALAAVPTVANATPTMYTNYVNWDGAVSSPSVKEYATFPGTDIPTPQPVSTVPLRGGVSLNVVSPTLRFNVVGTDWTSFWPNGLTSGNPFTGDILASNSTTNRGALITSIALTLSSPLTDFGFVALPADSGNPYDLTVTLLDQNDVFITQEDASIGPGNSCAQGTPPPSGAPQPCGFFGYTGGQSVYGIDLSIDNSACFANTSEKGAINNSVTLLACNGGLAIGDFVVGQVAPAPEPASLAILGAGLVGLGAIRRRLKA